MTDTILNAVVVSLKSAASYIRWESDETDTGDEMASQLILDAAQQVTKEMRAQ
jgi:hypothetical protein